MKFTGNSEYKVVIVRSARAQFAQILRYIRQNLGNEQAAKNVKEDMEDRLRLSQVAGSLKLCDDPELRARGYRTIHLRRHRYFLLYKIIDDNIVRVDGIYHDLQDYEGILR